MPYALALAELVTCNDDIKPGSDISPIFKLYDLAKMYSNTDMCDAVQAACVSSRDDDATGLVRAANILRNYTLKTDCTFQGNFCNECQVDSVPKSLISIISMIQHGPGMVNQCENTQTVLSLAQFMQYNYYKR